MLKNSVVVVAVVVVVVAFVGMDAPRQLNAKHKNVMFLVYLLVCFVFCFLRFFCLSVPWSAVCRGLSPLRSRRPRLRRGLCRVVLDLVRLGLVRLALAQLERQERQAELVELRLSPGLCLRDLLQEQQEQLERQEQRLVRVRLEGLQQLEAAGALRGLGESQVAKSKRPARFLRHPVRRSCRDTWPRPSWTGARA